jgi:hypothetical protein
MPKKLYDMLDLPPVKYCYLDVNLADNSIKKPLRRIDNVHITVINNLVPVDFVVLDIKCNASCPIILGRPFLRTVGAIYYIIKTQDNIRCRLARDLTKSKQRPRLISLVRPGVDSRMQI